MVTREDTEKFKSYEKGLQLETFWHLGLGVTISKSCIGSIVFEQRVLCQSWYSPARKKICSENWVVER